MSKEINKLLTRANAFEKLALYSDRQSFLKAIAKREDDETSNDIMELASEKLITKYENQ